MRECAQQTRFLTRTIKGTDPMVSCRSPLFILARFTPLVTLISMRVIYANIVREQDWCVGCVPWLQPARNISVSLSIPPNHPQHVSPLINHASRYSRQCITFAQNCSVICTKRYCSLCMIFWRRNNNESAYTFANTPGYCKGWFH